MMINVHKQPVLKSLPPFNIKKTINLKESNLGEIVETVEGVLPQWVDRGIRTKTEYIHRNLCVMADRARLGEALMNLVLNAVEAMPDGGLLTIRTNLVRFQKEPIYIFNNYMSLICAVLSVTDSGIGMDKETVQRMFEPFFTTKPETGRGLGLSIAHSIVKKHRGCIKVESTPGKGTTVKVYLPLARTAIEEREAIPLPESLLANRMNGSRGRSRFVEAG
jgi:two-component system cell cycle sensor histidine kinase/response regulator CckA